MQLLWTVCYNVKIKQPHKYKIGKLDEHIPK